jgi:hypothetical protein
MPTLRWASASQGADKRSQLWQDFRPSLWLCLVADSKERVAGRYWANIFSRAG